MPSSPFQLFSAWYKEATSAKIVEPNAVNLSTVDSLGNPSSRIVLLKGVFDDKFRIYTCYSSDKGRAIDSNPNVSMLWYWDVLEQQVRVKGVAARTSRAETEAYFRSRPRESQLSAYVSAQSQVVSSRDELEKKRLKAIKELEGKDVPLPDNWGGYDIAPSYFEFWQGRANRFHDRLVFERNASSWSIKRLEP